MFEFEFFVGDHLNLSSARLNAFPHGLGKGHDAAIVGAWLAQEAPQVSPASVAIWC